MATALTLLGLGLWAGAIIVFVNGVAASQTGRKPGTYRPMQGSTQSPLDPARFGVGATVRYSGADHDVVAVVSLRQELRGYGVDLVWHEYRLERGTDVLWLSVLRDENRLQILRWTPRADLALRPIGAHIVDGDMFRDHERGRAEYRSRGPTGLPARGVVEFADYVNGDGTKFLGFRRWSPDEPREVRFGQTVDARALAVRLAVTRPRRERVTAPRKRRYARPHVWRKRFTSSPAGVVLHGLGQAILQTRKRYRADPRDKLFGVAGFLAIAGTFCFLYLLVLSNG